MASNTAGISQALRKLARTVKDINTQNALIAIEIKIEELDIRLADTERRLKAGGL
jgi:hypothetical protein